MRVNAKQITWRSELIFRCTLSFSVTVHRTWIKNVDNTTFHWSAPIIFRPFCSCSCILLLFDIGVCLLLLTEITVLRWAPISPMGMVCSCRGTSTNFRRMALQATVSTHLRPAVPISMSSSLTTITCHRLILGAASPTSMIRWPGRLLTVSCGKCYGLVYFFHVIVPG